MGPRIQLFLVAVFLAWSPTALGTNLSTLEFGTQIGSELQILRSESRLSIQEVIDRQSDFTQTKQKVPRFGYTKDDVWAKLTLTNPQAASKTIYMEFPAPIEKLTVYVVVSGKVIKTAKSGMFLRQDEEQDSVRHSHPVVKISLPPGDSTIYLSEKAVAPHYPLIIHDEASLAAKQASNAKANYFLLGISATFFIMMLIISVFVNRLSSLLLLLSFVSYFQLIGFISGLFRAIAGSEVESIILMTYRYWPSWCGLYFLLLSGFAISYLGKEKFFAGRVFRILTYISLASQGLLIVASPFDTVISMNLFSAGVNIILFQAAYISFKNAMNGKKEDMILAAGWVIFSFFTTMQLFYYLGVFEFEFFAIIGTIIGFYMLIALSTITLVLNNRIELLRVIVEKRDALTDLERNFGELRKREEIIRIFSNPLISVEISLGRNPLEYQPRYLENAVLFFDMRGFTSLSENLNLLDVYKIVNLYAENIIEGVHAHAGFVDKIIGDAVMARFKDSDDCMRAVAAIRMALIGLNRHRVASGTFPVKFGTGISFGKVLSANFGSAIKLDRTIIGDIVNISSRVESLTKVFKVDVLYDESFRESLKDKVEFTRFVGVSTLVGRRHVTNLYEYFGHNLKSVRDLKVAHGPAIQKAWDMADSGYVADALDGLEQAIKDCPPHSIKSGELMDETLRSVHALIISRYQEPKAA